MSDIISSRHHEYTDQQADWKLYRDILDGGRQFVRNYLKRLSVRETVADFEERVAVSYNPAYAKAALIDIRNAIFSRLPDINRTDGDRTYIEAINGRMGGVDRESLTMNGFIGHTILLDLLGMGKIGVYIDKAPLDGLTRADTKDLMPYLYVYDALDILSWRYDQNILTHLLLRDFTDEYDEYGLVTGTKETYRFLQLTDSGVFVQFLDEDGNETSSETLDLQNIPFVLFELSESLLTEVAGHQIALLQLASSDVNYGIKGNFPFYTEQYDPMTVGAHLKPDTVDADDTTKNADPKNADAHKIEVGATRGRRYPKGLDRPDFIAPPSEPLKTSIEKQKEIIKEIRLLVNLSVQNLEVRRASDASRREDNRSLEAGLACVAIELEQGENAIARIWADYQKSSSIASIKYPTTFSLKSDEDRQIEAKRVRDEIPVTPSLVAQKELAKLHATALFRGRIDDQQLEIILDEIDSASIIDLDADRLITDVKEGLLSHATASQLRKYASTEVTTAQAEQAERLKRIQEAQAPRTTDPAARGVPDADPNPQSAIEEKSE